MCGIIVLQGHLGTYYKCCVEKNAQKVKHKTLDWISSWIKSKVHVLTISPIDDAQGKSLLVASTDNEYAMLETTLTLQYCQ